ncbi:MAG TPA: hypothetical protein VGG81_03350 [Edaphobacter sp.]|jgi:hypothetical protein
MAMEKNLKTPPESDPSKENRNISPGSETLPPPVGFEAMDPEDDGTVKAIDEETPAF